MSLEDIGNSRLVHDLPGPGTCHERPVRRPRWATRLDNITSARRLPGVRYGPADRPGRREASEQAKIKASLPCGVSR